MTRASRLVPVKVTPNNIETGPRDQVNRQTKKRRYTVNKRTFKIFEARSSIAKLLRTRVAS